MSIQEEVEKLGQGTTMQSGVTKGQCTSCGDYNPYTATICAGCGSRLPWADALSGNAKATASTHAPLSIANARATVNPSAPASQGSAASASSNRWFGSTGAVALLVVGALIGAAIVAPNFASFSKPTPPKGDPPTAMPTPNVKAPAVSPATPQRPTVSPSQPQPDQGQPTLPQPAVTPQQPALQSDADDYQLPMKETDSVPQIIADISADIKAANTAVRADQITFACHRIEANLRDQARNNVKDVDISSNWAMAMGHLASAAEAKSALLSNPPDYDVQRLSMNLNAELFNAKNSGKAAQQFIDEKNNPDLARQNRERFRQRTDEYERYNRDVARGNSR